jgi:hypothetical protein
LFELTCYSPPNLTLRLTEAYILDGGSAANYTAEQVTDAPRPNDRIKAEARYPNSPATLKSLRAQECGCKQVKIGRQKHHYFVLELSMHPAPMRNMQFLSIKITLIYQMPRSKGLACSRPDHLKPYGRTSSQLVDRQPLFETPESQVKPNNSFHSRI